MTDDPDSSEPSRDERDAPDPDGDTQDAPDPDGDTQDAPDPIEPARAWVFGDDVDTDQIIPSRFIVSGDPDELAEHAFEDLRPAFAAEVRPGEFVVGGENFGSGSSREQAPLSLVGAGVAGVVARSFARIFFRNAINLGLPVLICPDADRVRDGDEVHMDIGEGVVVNHTREERYEAEPLPEFLQSLVEQGGLEAYTRAKLEDG